MVSNILTGLGTLSNTTLASDLSIVCQSGCMASLKTAFQGIQQSCSNTDLDNLQGNLTIFLQMYRLLCLTDASSTVQGGYCLPIVDDASRAIASGPLNASTLNAFCQPCVTKYLALSSSFVYGGSGAVSVAFSSGFFCMTDLDNQGNPHYCLLEFQSAYNQNTNLTSFLERKYH